MPSIIRAHCSLRPYDDISELLDWVVDLYSTTSLPAPQQDQHTQAPAPETNDNPVLVEACQHIDEEIKKLDQLVHNTQTREPMLTTYKKSLAYQKRHAADQVEKMLPSYLASQRLAT